MRVNVGWQAVIALAVVALVAYLLWKAKSAAGAVAEVVSTKLNPASDQNVVYQGANTVVQKITGNDTATVGTAIYDTFHDDCGGLKWPWQDSSCN